MAALVIAEHDNASIKAATLNTVTAAIACGGDVHVLVAGKDAAEEAQDRIRQANSARSCVVSRLASCAQYSVVDFAVKSRSTTGAGVPAGANRPVKVWPSKSL